MFYKHSKWFWVALLGFLIFLTFGAYFKVLRAEFVYDDFGFIVNNKAIQSFVPFSKFFTDPNIFTGAQDNLGGKNWRPISSLAFAIEYRFFGPNPFGFHFASILLHLLDIVLVYFLINKLTNRAGVALTVSSLWALHPVLTEAVSWIANQSSLIFFGFFLLAILALLKKQFWISYSFFGLSLLSKETALGGIFVIAVVFFIFLKEHWKKFAPFIGLSLIYLLARYEIIGSMGDHVLRGSFWQNLLLAPVVFIKYITLSIWPVNLLLDYSNFPLPASIIDIRVMLGILFFVSLALLACLGWKKHLNNFSLGLVWFVAFLLPVLQVVPFQDIVGERFLYAPLVGFFMAVVLGFNKLIDYVKSKFNFNLAATGKIIFGLVLIMFFVLTLNRNNDWLNSENLWNSVIKIDSRNKRALQNLSAFYLQRGDADNIVEFSKKLLEIDPENKAGRLHLAVGEILSGNYKEAETELLDLIEKYPDFKEAQNNLIVLYQQLGRQGSFVETTASAPAVEGNIVNSGIAGKAVLLGGGPYEYEASLEIFKSNNLSTPFISVRTHSDGTFQVPLRPDFYILKPMDPDGPVAPVRSNYSFVIGGNQWLQVKIEYTINE